MANIKEPVAESMLDWDNATTLPWSEVLRYVKQGTQWLATVRPDGRPHVVPVGIGWVDGKPYFTTGQGTRKEKNVKENAHCVVTNSSQGFDIVVEGTATHVTDMDTLERVAAYYSSPENGWPAVAKDGALDAPYSAPTTGPAPYEVYEITPTVAFALGNTEETVNQATRYRF